MIANMNPTKIRYAGATAGAVMSPSPINNTLGASVVVGKMYLPPALTLTSTGTTVVGAALITVASTADLAVGMVVTKGTGSYTLAVNQVITAINSATTFTITGNVATADLVPGNTILINAAAPNATFTLTAVPTWSATASDPTAGVGSPKNATFTFDPIPAAAQTFAAITDYFYFTISPKGMTFTDSGAMLISPYVLAVVTTATNGGCVIVEWTPYTYGPVRQ